MSDPNSPHPQAYTPPPPNPYQPAIIVYAVFAASFLLAPIAIGALIYAYIEKGKSGEVDTHLTFMIQTFWIGLAIMLVGVLTTWLLIGFVILLGWFLWVVVRMITGFQLALARQPIRGTELIGMKAV
ncbi:DUF4870 family protein [Gymnodinialimonas ulvae]|uniref:DUF4870 family protein n=1 Tax=Gymnodinialimonas ulvae TaxID=3126504 RepID=UPI0030A6B988